MGPSTEVGERGGPALDFAVRRPRTVGRDEEEWDIAGLDVAPNLSAVRESARREVVGIVGGGQLARMTVQAAISLSVDVRVLAAAPGDPADVGGAEVEIGDPADPAALDCFSRGCDVMTFDHELVDPEVVAGLERRGRRVFPGSHVLRFADKAHQRRGLSALGAAVPVFEIVRDAAAIGDFARERGWPVVAKLSSGGYDGRGVFVLDGVDAARELMARGPGVDLVVEPYLAIERELAVVLARRPSGEHAVYPVVETWQHDGICRETIVPAAVAPALGREAVDVAVGIAEAIGAVGILAVELFVVDGALVVNELAPRPHNSAHWTIEGAVTSQFENHLRAVLDWPLGDTSLMAPAVATVNVLGNGEGLDPRDVLPGALSVPGAHPHLYAKEPRPGRKLGHVTVTAADRDEALTRARRAAALLGTESAREPKGET